MAVGERINFPNPEAMVTLSAAAAVTERVALAFGVLVLPMHRPVLLAKQLATLDVLCGGRLSVGVGVGGRREDYEAIGAVYDRRLLSRLEEGVATMRRAWAGEIMGPGILGPVGPEPLQAGRPRDHARRAVPAVDPARCALGRRHLGVQLRPDVRGRRREVRARTRGLGRGRGGRSRRGS